MRVQILNYWKLRLLALAVFGVGSPSNPLHANVEMDGIVRHLNLSVSDRIISSQTHQLSPQFSQLFLTTAELNQQTVMQYFSKHPTEVMAFRAYMQQLVDLGVLSGDSAEGLVISAFKALEMATQKETLKQREIAESTQPHKHSDLNLSILNNPPDASDKSVASLPLLDSSQSEMLDFGDNLEQEQKASLAADELENALEEQQRIERNTRLARALIDEFSQGNPTPESLGKRVERVVTEFAEVESKKQAETLLDNVEVSITSLRNGPEYSVRGLKAFDNLNPNYFSFTEFGLTVNDDDSTVNIGIGIRKLSDDQTVMGGVNAFYDQEIDTNHKRGSIGIELISAPFRFNANRYYALSDGYQLTALQTEKPLSGHDVDVEVAIPYLPGLYAGYNQSKWYGEDNATDIERKIYRLGGNLSQNVSVEIGKRTYSSNIEDQNTAKLSYNYVFDADTDEPKILNIDTQPYRHRKIGPRERYRMVERQNKIVTQVSQSGLTVTFTAL